MFDRDRNVCQGQLVEAEAKLKEAMRNFKDVPDGHRYYIAYGSYTGAREDWIIAARQLHHKSVIEYDTLGKMMKLEKKHGHQVYLLSLGSKQMDL